MFKIHLLSSIFLKENGKHIQNLLLNSALSLKNQPELPFESKTVADEQLVIKKGEIYIVYRNRPLCQPRYYTHFSKILVKLSRKKTPRKSRQVFKVKKKKLKIP